MFKNKKGDFKHIQEGLYNNFPKLREAGGFELYRQQDGKSLCYITPPASGYTIPFLKYTYGIKSAILYVLPIQRSLSMDPVPLDEEEVCAVCIYVLLVEKLSLSLQKFFTQSIQKIHVNINIIIKIIYHID